MQGLSREFLFVGLNFGNIMEHRNVESERLFENKKQSSEWVRDAQKKYYRAIDSSTDRFHSIALRHCGGKQVLEIGCSDGKHAVMYAGSALAYVGIDISDVAIEKANNRELPNAVFMNVDAHQLPFEAVSFDLVIVNSLLHHLLLELALPEICRVLRRDGHLVFREPLGINPLFVLYRSLTPSARTADERPFTLGDLRLINQYFDTDYLECAGFTSLMCVFPWLKSALPVLERFDMLLSRTPIRYWFWQMACTCRPRKF